MNYVTFMKWSANYKHKTIKIFVLLFINIFFFFSILGVTEVVYRIKHLGYKRALQSIFQATHQPSVLGTSNWVISDPDLGFRLNPVLSEVNEFSMREKEIVIPKPQGLIRIIVLGDSIPYSYSGNPTFVDLLKKKFESADNIEILNASTPGYTTYQEVEFLDKFLIKTQPDLIILTYCLNDNYKFLHRFDEEAKMLWTEEAEDSLEIDSAIDLFISKSYFLSTLKTKFIQERTKQKKSIFPWEDTTDFNLAWKDYSWLGFSSRLKKMNNILKKNDSKLFIVIFPLEMQLDQNLLLEDYQYVRKPQQQVSLYSNKYDIPYLDLFNVFYSNKQKGEKLFTDGLHLSSEGHNLTANVIYNFLNEVYFQSNIN